MQTTKNRQVLIVSHPSAQCEQMILILKENVVHETDKILNDARDIAARYAAKYEKRKRVKSAAQREWYKVLAAMFCGVLAGVGVSLLFF